MITTPTFKASGPSVLMMGWARMVIGSLRLVFKGGLSACPFLCTGHATDFLPKWQYRGHH